MQEKFLKNVVFLPFSFVADMEAECSDDVMKLRVKFNDTFSGLIYSAGKLNFNISFNSLGLLAFLKTIWSPNCSDKTDLQVKKRQPPKKCLNRSYRFEIQI